MITHCGTTFSSKSNLNNHLKMTKYCLKLRGKSFDSFNCNGCGKNFHISKRLQNHENICVDFIKKIYVHKLDSLEKINNNLQNKNEVLENKINSMSNNIQINNKRIEQISYILKKMAIKII